MLAAVPNSANATSSGPIIVPNELTPPPRLTRLLPVDGSPSMIENGWAPVCCSEKPSATMNRPPSMPANVLAFTAMIMTAAPSAENSRPNTMLFL